MSTTDLRLVLASTSPRRSEMLRNLRVQFEVMAPRPEAEQPLPKYLALSPLHEQLRRVAESKAADVLQGCEFPCLVVAADTIVYAQGQVLGKPGDEKAAREQLKRLSGRRHRVLSAVAVARRLGDVMVSSVETTDVRFRVITEDDLDLYLATGEPLDKAGSYGIQGWGGLFVESIKGRYDNVVGFPLVSLERLLQQLGSSLYAFRDST